MFMGGSIQQWQDVGLYMIFMVLLFTGIYFISVKLSNYYIQEQNKRKKLNQLKNKYHCKEKNYYKKVA